MNINPGVTVSFSGHRSFKMTGVQGSLFGTDVKDNSVLASSVKQELRKLCAAGYDTFLCGMAEGFDLAAAEAVISTKSEFPGIRLIAVVPYTGQARTFDEKMREKYNILMEAADHVIILSEVYTPDCFHRRNDFLLDNSSVLVCYFNGSKGGTAYTVKQALKKGLKVINTLNNS